MARYIDSEILLKKLFPYEMLNDGNYGINAKAVKKAVENTPTADVVEVVRCKDCKKRYVPYYCALWHSTVNGREMFIERGDNFFCGHGERKEKEE